MELTSICNKIPDKVMRVTVSNLTQCCIISAMTKADAIQKAGSIANLARILGITTNAISNWSDEKHIPTGREWQLKALRPEWFTEQKTKGNS